MPAPIHWRRALAFGLLATTTLLLVLAAPRLHHAWTDWRTPVPPLAGAPAVAATDTQQSAIIAAVVANQLGVDPADLARGYSTHWGSRMVVSSTTRVVKRRPEPSPGDAEPPPFDSVPWWDTDLPIPRGLRAQLYVSAASTTTLVDPQVRWVVLESAETVAEFLVPPGLGADEFRRRFPEAGGFMAFSRAVVSVDGRQALVYFEHHSSAQSGLGSLALLEVAGEGWRVVAVEGVWVS